MSIFKKCNALSVQSKPVVVSVPDIKDYLVKEYERANTLAQEKENLKQKLDEANEIKIKYDAAMVTLDEYSRRLQRYDSLLEEQMKKVEAEKKAAESIRDELNSYKIKLNMAGETREEIIDLVVNEIKSDIIVRINSHKGNLSKKVVCQIVGEAMIPKTQA